MCLTWKARLQPGETVVALGAGGAVGQSVIGAAKAVGAGGGRRVPARAQHRPRPSGRGRRGGRAARRPCGDDLAAHQPARPTVDVVVDPVGGAAATAALQVLGLNGRLVNLGGSMADATTYSSAVLRAGRWRSSATPTTRSRRATPRGADRGARARRRGQIRVAHETCPLDQAGDAWTRQAAGEVDGRLVLVP